MFLRCQFKVKTSYGSALVQVENFRGYPTIFIEIQIHGVKLNATAGYKRELHPS